MHTRNLASQLPDSRHKSTLAFSQHEKKGRKHKYLRLPTRTCIHMHKYFGKIEESVDGGFSARFLKLLNIMYKENIMSSYGM